jgi:hypothetical protein
MPEKLSFEELQSLRKHNKSVMANEQGELSATKVRDNYQSDFGSLVGEVVDVRKGAARDSNGAEIPGRDISLSEAIKYRYGVSLQKYLTQIGIYVTTDSLGSIAKRLGYAGVLDKNNLTDMLNNHTSFVANTKDFNEAYRFLIPELILAPIYQDYEAAINYINWIGTTHNLVGNTKAVVPLIKKGEMIPRRIGEAESIPFGTVTFGQKNVETFKIGCGFAMTDEMVANTKISLLFKALAEVGVDMAIATDVEAFNILINGEQSDGSQSAPVIGVKTAGSFTYKDLRKSFGRMSRLKRDCTRLITSEDDGIELSELQQFAGFAGQTQKVDFRTILGVPPTLVNDIFTMPAGQIMLIDPNKAMDALNYGSMMTEKRRNPQNQTDEIFVSKHVGFFIVQRDGRLIVDKSKSIATDGFPSYMDIDARISKSFENLL